VTIDRLLFWLIMACNVSENMAVAAQLKQKTASTRYDCSLNNNKSIGRRLARGLVVGVWFIGAIEKHYALPELILTRR
jgi:hypothetical protein